MTSGLSDFFSFLYCLFEEPQSPLMSADYYSALSQGADFLLSLTEASDKETLSSVRHMRRTEKQPGVVRDKVHFLRLI